MTETSSTDSESKCEYSSETIVMNKETGEIIKTIKYRQVCFKVDALDENVNEDVRNEENNLPH